VTERKCSLVIDVQAAALAGFDGFGDGRIYQFHQSFGRS